MSNREKPRNAAGEKPPGCDVLERTAVVADPIAVVWRGLKLSIGRRGIKVLGIFCGAPNEGSVVVSGPLYGRSCELRRGTMLGCGSVCAQFYRSHQIKEKAQFRVVVSGEFWVAISVQSEPACLLG